MSDLDRYEKLRNFDRTSEPGADTAGTYEEREQEIFVIQKHAASRLHYDFRLESGGTLKSWAIPKGPSLNPSEKRLAVAVEDHPVDYADFEGVIPEGEYGGGEVLIWDRGTYRHLSETEEGKGVVDFSEAYREGLIVFELFGKKLKGKWALIHARLGGQEKNWLLVKKNDEYAERTLDIVDERPASVVSGRTIEEMQ